MRLGSQPAELTAGSKSALAYDTPEISEDEGVRHSLGNEAFLLVPIVAGRLAVEIVW